MADKCQSFHMGGIISALVAGGAGWFRHQADLLVVADRLHLAAGLSSQIAYRQIVGHHFLLEPIVTVGRTLVESKNLSRSNLMTSYISLILGGVALLTTPSLVWAQQQADYHGPHMMWSGWYMGPIMMIVFLAIAVIVVVLIVRWLSGSNQGHSHSAPPAKEPVDILKERFARGEIDKEEFEERRRVLEN